MMDKSETNKRASMGKEEASATAAETNKRETFAMV
jgi:hypothetical protein